MKALRVILQIAFALLVLAIAATIALLILSERPVPEVLNRAFAAPTVRTHRVTIEDQRIDIDAQGVVEPFREIDLAAQVGGRVVAVSPALRAGGFFAAGDVLVEIEATDYELAVVQQEAAVARAKLRLLQEKAEADAALRAWKELEGQEPTDPLVRREPQIADAEKALEAAEAQLFKSRLDLERTKVTAPFAGRVRTAGVDEGQVIQPGAPLAHIYGTEFAEVRLPLQARDAAFLELPLRWTNGESAGPRPSVDLFADFGGREYAYRGTIVRTEGEVDRRTRQLTVVARVDDPYAQSGPDGRPPLALGTFVRARIHGRTFADIAELPREALDGQHRVWAIVTRIHFLAFGWFPVPGPALEHRQVEVLREFTNTIYVDAGLESGELVCTTRLAAPVDGMPVRLFRERTR